MSAQYSRLRKSIEESYTRDPNYSWASFDSVHDRSARRRTTPNSSEPAKISVRFCVSRDHPRVHAGAGEVNSLHLKFRGARYREDLNVTRRRLRRGRALTRRLCASGASV